VGDHLEFTPRAETKASIHIDASVAQRRPQELTLVFSKRE
jgi:hypothetical protein